MSRVSLNKSQYNSQYGSRRVRKISTVGDMLHTLRVYECESMHVCINGEREESARTASLHQLSAFRSLFA